MVPLCPMEVSVSISSHSHLALFTRRRSDLISSFVVSQFIAPLINIKKALVALREDVANMNVQIGILQHDILHSKLREKLLMQQKLHSQVYA